MPNKNYERGRRFEHRVKKHLEKQGYLVVRSAGSKSPFDLVGISLKVYQPAVILVQCKYGAKIGKNERDNLRELAKQLPNCVFVLTAWAKPNKPIVFYDSDNEVVEW